MKDLKIHFVGAGGIGVSGAMRIAAGRGAQVSGSDSADSPIVAKLRAENFPISIPQKSENIPAGCNLVVYTTACKSDNPELVAARESGIETLTYPEFLGRLTDGFRTVAVAGTHGKTTTTGLLVSILLTAGEDFTALVGSNLKELDGGNARVGAAGGVFVVEACEYRRGFLNLQPEILAVTNVEGDHLDYFRDEEDYVSAFVSATENSQILVADSHEKNVSKIIPAARKFIDAAENSLEFELQIPGEHNRKNARLAAKVARQLGIPDEKIREGLGNYRGSWRRFELRGEFRGVPVIDDYAHHPTEIRATLAAARERFPEKRIVVVYQQHQLDRARRFLSELGESFGDADVAVIPRIYAVRDEAGSADKISGADIADAIRSNGREAIFTDSFEATLDWLRENLQANDVLLVAGAGDVFEITEELLHQPN